MVYVSRDELNTLSIEQNEDEIKTDTLLEVEYRCPSLAIYIEKDSFLYGMISLGDIKRAYEDNRQSVSINKSFISIMPEEYMRALQVFNNKDNILMIPVVDEFGILRGEYIRYNDALNLQNLFSSHKDWFVGQTIGLVEPCCEYKNKYYRTCRNILEKICNVNPIPWNRLPDRYDSVDRVLFVDEAERLYARTLCGFRLEDRSRVEYLDSISLTYSKIPSVGKNIYEIVHQFLRGLQNKGVYVLILESREVKTDYMKKLVHEIKNKYYRIGENVSLKLFPEFYEDFCGSDVEREYCEELSNQNPTVELIDGMYRFKDTESKTFNVINRERVTVGQPPKFSHTIFFVGTCMMGGVMVEDAHTIPSFVQKMFNDDGFNVKCVNMGIWGGGNCRAEFLVSECMRITYSPIKTGDVIVLNTMEDVEYSGFNDIPTIIWEELVDRKRMPAAWFLDSVTHGNKYVNYQIAEHIYKTIQEFGLSEGERKTVEMDDFLFELSFLKDYFDDIDLFEKEKVGAIVMNCNPFTYGHRHLIEYAIERMDYLIIFVVEEDMSVFPFDVRIAAIRAGVSDLENVRVVPSGKFILSNKTFPEYFIKIADEDIVCNVENDIRIFAKSIAPNLNIKYRFVGEELNDIVTNEYNKAMKRILPEYGIKLFEIPRKEQNGMEISASKVREYIESGEWDKVQELVPKTTIDILRWEYS